MFLMIWYYGNLASVNLTAMWMACVRITGKRKENVRNYKSISIIHWK